MRPMVIRERLDIMQENGKKKRELTLSKVPATAAAGENHKMTRSSGPDDISHDGVNNDHSMCGDRVHETLVGERLLP